MISRMDNKQVSVIAAVALRCPLLALSGQSNRARVCPLLDQQQTKSDFFHNSLSVNDPTATLAVHCGNGFDAGFSPYQCTRLCIR
jgi:hypothetical protein